MQNEAFFSTIHKMSAIKQIHKYHMSRDVRKPDFCICENEDADLLRGNRKADQRLCFRYLDRTFILFSKSQISSLLSSSVAAQP